MPKQNKIYQSVMKWASPSYKEEQETPKKKVSTTYKSTEDRYKNRALAEQVKRQAEQDVEKKYRKKGK